MAGNARAEHPGRTGCFQGNEYKRLGYNPCPLNEGICAKDVVADPYDRQLKVYMAAAFQPLWISELWRLKSNFEETTEVMSRIYI